MQDFYNHLTREFKLPAFTKLKFISKDVGPHAQPGFLVLRQKQERKDRDCDPRHSDAAIDEWCGKNVMKPLFDDTRAAFDVKDKEAILSFDGENGQMEGHRWVQDDKMLGCKGSAACTSERQPMDQARSFWLTKAQELFELEDNPQGADLAIPAAPAKPAVKKSQWTRKNPYEAKLIENRLLSRDGSGKEIRHIAFDLGDSGIEYATGDALGVMPTNSPDLVTALLERLGASADQTIAGHEAPLGELLARQFEIRTPSRELLKAIEPLVGHDELTHVLTHQDKEALDAFLWGKDVLDLLNLNPDVAFDAGEFLSWSKPLQHRAYSISSCPMAHPGEVHLTVAAVRWSGHANGKGREHQGVASCFLADQCGEGKSAPVFVSPNKNFRVPTDGDAPMIMVGPGTGIAPFRAFLEERRERGDAGKNWLFFGDQHRAHDFIYDDEISAASQSGLLTRLDLAFSRDQAEKIYVQTRMRENAKELFGWLEEGGYFFVCGDATRMAKDVDSALHEIIAAEGGLSEEQASEYVANLKREKRYVRDVY